MGGEGNESTDRCTTGRLSGQFINRGKDVLATAVCRAVESGRAMKCLTLGEILWKSSNLILDI